MLEIIRDHRQRIQSLRELRVRVFIVRTSLANTVNKPLVEVYMSIKDTTLIYYL